jgi:hypothetical protein
MLVKAGLLQRQKMVDRNKAVNGFGERIERISAG